MVVTKDVIAAINKEKGKEVYHEYSGLVPANGARLILWKKEKSKDGSIVDTIHGIAETHYSTLITTRNGPKAFLRDFLKDAHTDDFYVEVMHIKR